MVGFTAEPVFKAALTYFNVRQRSLRMEDINKDEVTAKSMKYAQPKLVSFDDNKGAEGGLGDCTDGSAPSSFNCGIGGSAN